MEATQDVDPVPCFCRPGFDAVGHDAHMDVFRLTMTESEQAPVAFDGNRS
ncbi:MAG: hypothetical protein NVS9B8_09980 [Candidatus Limnocylindrales bacterium]